MTPYELATLNKVEAYVTYLMQMDAMKLEEIYKVKAESGDIDQAAEAARAYRNQLLVNTDQYMTIDRVGLDLSSPEALVQSLQSVFQSDWATYRQQLRDIPQQAGFPLNIEFPVPPNHTLDY